MSLRERVVAISALALALGSLHISPADFCAGIGETGTQARYLKLTARRDGSFMATNSRNGLHKDYPPGMDR